MEEEILGPSKEELLSDQYGMLGHGLVNGITEIRIPTKDGYMKSEWCKNGQEFIEKAKKYLQQNAYVGINPRSKESGKAEDIGFITCLVIDIDPVRPKGAASSDQQLQEALGLGASIATDYKGFRVSSGSGCHVYIPCRPIKVENRELLTKEVKFWMDDIRKKYQNEKNKIDPIHDLPRVIRLWGSLNSKSLRICKPISDVSIVERQDIVFEQTEQEVLTPEADKKLTLGLASEYRMRELAKTNKRLAGILDGSISPGDGSPSSADYEFVKILHEAHFSHDEIRELYAFNPRGNKKPKHGHNGYPDDVAAICGKLDTESKSNSTSLTTGFNRYLSGLKTRCMGIRTGFQSFDEMTSGLKKQKLYIFAARPNDGKTTLITQILSDIAETGETCLFYPTEVGPDPIFDKIVSRKTGINLKKFQNGTFLEDDYKRIESVRESVSKIPLIVVEDFGLTVSKIEEGIKQYAPSILAVDFFQALKWQDVDSVGEKADAVRKLKEIAGDYNIPVILASQLNRNDGKSDLRNLKGTGTLEELGDVITYLLVEPGARLQYPRPVSLVIMKSKYSATGAIELDLYCDECRFTERSNG